MVCLIGNSLICIAVYRNAKLRSSTNLYIISLAISDIINAVIVMPLLWVSLLQVNGLLVRQSAISTPSSPCFLFTYPQPRWDWRPSTDTSASLSLKTTHESSLILDQKYISLQFGWLSRGTFPIPKMGGLTEYRFFAGYAACIVEQPTIAMKIVHCIIVVCFFVLVPLGVALVSY